MVSFFFIFLFFFFGFRPPFFVKVLLKQPQLWHHLRISFNKMFWIICAGSGDSANGNSPCSKCDFKPWMCIFSFFSRSCIQSKNSPLVSGPALPEKGLLQDIGSTGFVCPGRAHPETGQLFCVPVPCNPPGVAKRRRRMQRLPYWCLYMRFSFTLFFSGTKRPEPNKAEVQRSQPSELHLMLISLHTAKTSKQTRWPSTIPDALLPDVFLLMACMDSSWCLRLF